jgi:hypothetical protein
MNNTPTNTFFDGWNTLNSSFSHHFPIFFPSCSHHFPIFPMCFERRTPWGYTTHGIHTLDVMGSRPAKWLSELENHHW